MSVVTVSDLSKIYERNVPLWRWFGRGLGWIKAPARSGQNGAVAALEAVSFCVRKGEAFGVIGRNGAGKSTLLQILAGTLAPTTGRYEVTGRVTALLELGSGFNPDFTGRENVYLAGSILGIGRAQMDLKFPEIEAFAEIGTFIDQPVRTYSTGMLMRVAFSVAVAVEPDILIIDEALSVGDILFQQKCNRRMRELMDAGVTLLVVTHDTSFVLNLCQRALWLHRGKPRYLGEAGPCVREYLAAMAAEAGNTVTVSTASSDLARTTLPGAEPLDLSRTARLGDGGIKLARIWALNETGGASTVFKLGEWCRVVVLIEAERAVRFASAGCELRDRHGQVMFVTGLRVTGRLIDEIAAGDRRAVEMKFKVELAPGQYTLDVGCGAGAGDENTWQRVPAAAVFEVCASAGDEVVHGLVRLPHEVTAFRV
jgi:ABC-type polysaccharide/polyol phosphate transport system ATPase subunit